MRLLALDLGKRHTGVAFGDDKTQFVVALDTVHHVSIDELIERLHVIIAERKVERLVIGLPKLPDGTEGEQARWVKKAVHALEAALQLPVTLLDERFTSKREAGKPGNDDNAKAACALLTVELDRTK